MASLPETRSQDALPSPAIEAEAEAAADAAAPDAAAPDEPQTGTGRPAPARRVFSEIAQRPEAPEVRALARVDERHALFLNQRGQIGVAKFTSGLSLIGWEIYSELAAEALPQLALGPEYSVVYASPWELTQGFDTEGRGRIDFHQALLRNWQGRDDGVAITAGPVADRHGRLLYALSPYSHGEGEEPMARIYAWHPEAADPEPVTESQLPIAAFALGRDGTLAALLEYPGYEEGYYVSLTDLPPYHRPSNETPPDLSGDGPLPGSDAPDPAPYLSLTPSPLPRTRPSLLVPASLTGRAALRHLTYFVEHGQEGLLALAPDTGSIIEIQPDRPGNQWQGAILLRQVAEEASRPRALVEMSPGQVLVGGNGGFARLEPDPEAFRITAVELADDGLVVHFSEEIDREAAVAPGSVQLRATSLDGRGDGELTFQPVVEREGRTLVLKSTTPDAPAVLRIACEGIRSSKGRKLLGSAAFYAIN